MQSSSECLFNKKDFRQRATKPRSVAEQKQDETKRRESTAHGRRRNETKILNRNEA